MSDLIETHLRAVFADDAERAPQATGLAGGARGIARRQTRRRAAVLGSGVLVALVVASMAILSNAHSGERSAPAATNTPAPSPSTSPSTPTSDQPSALYYRNVEVPVPAAMLDPNAIRCGVAVADAAYVATAAHRTCLATPPHPERLTTVVLQPTEDLRGRFRSGTRVLPDGRTEISSGVPGADLRIVVTSPDPRLADKLFGGLVIVQMAHGCPVRDTGGSTSTPPPQPAEVQGGSACAYSDSWLVSSTWLDAAQATRLAGLISSPPAGDELACPSPTGRGLVDYWVIRLRVPDGETLHKVPLTCWSDPASLIGQLWLLTPLIH